MQQQTMYSGSSGSAHGERELRGRTTHTPRDTTQARVTHLFFAMLLWTNCTTSRRIGAVNTAGSVTLPASAADVAS
jgi:hypothetical protein